MEIGDYIICMTKIYINDSAKKNNFGVIPPIDNIKIKLINHKIIYEILILLPFVVTIHLKILILVRIAMII